MAAMRLGLAHWHPIGKAGMSMKTRASMTSDNIEEIKTALAAMKEREASTRRSTIRAEDQSAAAQSDLAELKALLAANPDLGKLGEILARGDKRRKSLLAQQHRRPDAQERQAAATAATAAISARRQALSILSQPLTPPYYVTLDTPGFFLDYSDTYFDDQGQSSSMLQTFGISPGESWFKALLNTRKDDPRPYYPEFRFYFVWVNPSDYDAIVNVSSPVLVNGWAEAEGSWDLLGSYHAYLTVTAFLYVWRWSGWGTDPETGQSLDQTPYSGAYSQATVASLDAFGGNLFSSPSPEAATISPANPYDLGTSLIVIPGGATTVFEVGLQVAWSFDGTGQDQNIIFDTATDDYIVGCPFVQLEVLTGPPT
jgi:hypothetical protein